MKRILVTGASGCIGHYISDIFIRETSHELYLLVRDPNKFKIDVNLRPGIHLVSGNMRHLKPLTEIAKTVDCAILAAVAWGGSQETFDINVTKTRQLMEMLDRDRCEQVLYFSTASLLDCDNKILSQTSHLGTDYIRSKYDCFNQLARLPVYDRLTVLFPTLVFGGDENHPYSHLSSGLPDVVKWIDWIRFLQTDGSFHFIHALDVARVVCYLVEHPDRGYRQFVLGNDLVTVNQAIAQACDYLNKRIYFRMPLTAWLADFLIAIFRIQMASWDRFCLRYRHFTYQNPVNPQSFGLPRHCQTLPELLRVSGIETS